MAARDCVTWRRRMSCPMPTKGYGHKSSHASKKSLVEIRPMSNNAVDIQRFACRGYHLT